MELDYFRDRIKDRMNLIIPHVGIPDDMTYHSTSVLIKDEISKHPIENESIILRHIQITPKDYKNAIDETNMGNFERNPAEFVDALVKRAYVEMMPKSNFEQKNISFLESKNLLFETLDSLGESWGTDGPLNISGFSKDDDYKEKEFLNVYVSRHKTDNDSIKELSLGGFVIIAESEKNRNNFHYPNFKEYTAPSIIFSLGDGAHYQMNVLQKLYENSVNL